jgi:hypothetical protein
MLVRGTNFENTAALLQLTLFTSIYLSMFYLDINWTQLNTKLVWPLNYMEPTTTPPHNTNTSSKPRKLIFGIQPYFDPNMKNKFRSPNPITGWFIVSTPPPSLYSKTVRNLQNDIWYATSVWTNKKKCEGKTLGSPDPVTKLIILTS